MTSWTEDNFLERLMPQLRRENGAQTESCPDSELLSAFMEDRGSPFVRDAIAVHLTRCPKCHEICERLGQFAKAGLPAQDAEWVNVEKRLDNWMNGFLRARVDETRSELNVEPSTPVLRWNDISKAPFSWKVSWAVGVAAVLAFAVGGVVLTRRGPVAPAPVQIAQTQQIPPLAQGNPTPAPLENSIQTNDSANGSAKVSKSEQKPHSASRNNTPLQQSPPPASAEAAHLGKPQAVPPPQSSATTSDSTKQMARSYSPPRPGTSKNGPSAHAPIGRGIPMPSPMSSAFVSRQDQTQSPSALGDCTSAAGKVFQLEAGAYLWIWLNGTLPDTGTFTFRGTLMPPVARSGTVLLSPGTEIDVSGTMKRGDVASILVTEIVVQGVRYKLQGAAGATNIGTPGSGWALPFYEGQELEMQLRNASVYDSYESCRQGSYAGLPAGRNAAQGLRNKAATTKAAPNVTTKPAPPRN
jgi:hypothetical protein